MRRVDPKAPTRRRAPYITPDGAARLRTELDYLWRVKRPQVTQAVADAAALGDRSENAEYIYGKKQLREIDRRVRFLRKRLEEVRIIDRPPTDANRVYFGAWVQLEDAAGAAIEYRIVGADEFDMTKGWISVDSPLARALLGKAVDDEVTVQLPSGQAIYTVCRIRYAAPG